MRKLFGNKGFTLIELLVVIVILGILAGLAVPKVSEMIKGSKANAIVTNAQLVSRIVRQVYAEGNTAPTQADINAKLPTGSDLTSLGMNTMTLPTAAVSTYNIVVNVTAAKYGLAATDANASNFPATKTVNGIAPTPNAAGTITWTGVDAAQ